jgi:hypothetical protein
MKYKSNRLQNSDGKTKQTVRLDYQKFFSHLRENGTASERLLPLLRSIDRRASLEVANFVGSYLQSSQSDKDFLNRSQRAKRIKKMLPLTIKSLRKAAASYRELAAIEIPGAGSIINARAPSWVKAMPDLADVMDQEAARFTVLLEVSKKLYNKKRFGVLRNHLWLILLQEFVAVWTKMELGKEKSLLPTDIADLITAGKIALGWPEDNTETDPEDIRKAISNFRSNPANRWIATDGVRPKVNVFCQGLKHMPFWSGIEI